jgi:hypothetical protein
MWLMNWIPSTLVEKLTTLQNFSRGVAERAEVYGVSQGDAAEAVRLVGIFEATHQAATDPSTRTTITVAARKAAAEAAEKFCRRLGAFIRLKPGISEVDLAAISLPPKGEMRRIPPPTTMPILSIRRIIPGGHEIELFDSTSPDKRGKAEGASGLELFVAYSPNNGTGAGLTLEGMLGNAKPHGVLTRTLCKVVHPNERVGSVANYIGRWVNGRGEAGPFSQPVRMVLAVPGETSLKEAA